MATEQERKLKEKIKLTADLSKELKNVMEQADKLASEQYFGANAEKAKKTVSELKDEFQKIYDQADRNADRFSKPFDKFVSLTKEFPLNRIFDNSKVEQAQKTYKDNIKVISRQQQAGQISSTKAFTRGIGEQLKGIGNVTKAMGVSRLAMGGLIGGAILLAKKFFEVANAVDKGAAKLVKTSGVLDKSFNTTLIRATEQATLLGGDVALAAGYAGDFINKISPSVPLTGTLVGNLAQVGEKLQIGAGVATKLTQIISELNGVGFEAASGLIDKTISSLRLGPRIARDLAESYDVVIDKFGIGLNSLIDQTRQANRLGLSIRNVADFADKLLNLQSSISAEFKASAIIGQQINLQKARQLAFEGNIVGALNETLDRVEDIGGFEKLNFFQRKELAEATGLSVAELQKEINIRRQLGSQAKIEAATRETALGKIEEITRRIQAAIFQIFADPSVQAGFDKITDGIIDFLEGGKFEKAVQGLGDSVGKIAEFLVAFAEGRVDLFRGFTGRGFVTDRPETKVNDAVITPQGEVVKTNPRDYIIATQNPQGLTGGGNDALMAEMMGLLKELKNNGVRATTYLDGKQVSRQLGTSIRY